MELVASLGYLFKKGRAFGEADTYVAGALGACFGPNSLLAILVFTIFAAAIFTVPMFLYKQYKNNQKAVCILSILFTLSILIYKTVAINWFTFGFLALTGLSLIIIILRNLKAEENPVALPLVPAFSLATLYFIFF